MENALRTLPIADVNSVAKDLLYKVIKEELANIGVENPAQVAAKIILSYTRRTT